MMTFDHPEIEKAISNVSNITGVYLDREFQTAYQNGYYPKLLSYEKLDTPELEIPVLQKYLIASQTYLNQPCNYYDIYRVCRHVVLITLLSNSLQISHNNIEGLDERVQRLITATEYDDFDSILYEIITASNYYKNENVNKVAFIEESTDVSPDLNVLTNSGDMFIECKKFDRSVDISLEIRNIIRDKTSAIIDELKRTVTSAVVELSFHTNPNDVSAERIKYLVLESQKTGVPIIEGDLTVTIKNLNHQELDDYVLYPSPKYYWDRYKYRERSEWFGLVLGMYAKYAKLRGSAKVPDTNLSTWLDSVDWECAIKWKITDDEMLWRQKRLGYTRLFKGLNQLQARGTNTVLHVWFERDQSLGHRQNELVHFFNRIMSSARDIFAWIIFNETCFDVSYEGRFDLIENAHIISGPGRKVDKPLVACVFTEPDERTSQLAEFGIGHEMPDIDEIFNSNIPDR